MPSPKPDANEVSASKPMPVSVTSTPVPCAPLAGDTAVTLNCAKLGMSPNDTAVCRLTLPCAARSEEHTSELQSLMRISYAVFCLKKKKKKHVKTHPKII